MHADRVGVCLDTCHLLAAGYDIATPSGYRRTFAAFGRSVGFAKLEAFHLNDAKRPLGSRLDRHERIGVGFLGRATFRRIARDRRFAGLPMILETPAGMAGWKKEIRLLRRLLASSSLMKNPWRRVVECVSSLKRKAREDARRRRATGSNV